MSSKTTQPTIDPSAFWAVHEHRGRPLDPYAMLCSCVDCTAALHEHARREPKSLVALKTNCDRIVVTAEYLAETLRSDPSLSGLFYVADDWLRSIYVPSDAILPPGQRWWSLTCVEDDDALNRRRRVHRTAKRQSRAAREQRRFAEPTSTPVRRWPLVAFSDAIAPVRASKKEFLTAIAEWGLAQGERVDRDVLALILAAVDEGTGDVTTTRWTRTGVNHLLSIDTFNWCGIRPVLMPDGVPEALWLYLSYLHATDQLDPASDPIAELKKPLLCYGGLDDSGHPRSDDAVRTGPCECYVSYRGPRHGDRL